MIFRLSQKLSSKIKAGPLPSLPLDDNPVADWSCHLFVADRKQFILLTNTQSLYSTVMVGKGIANQSQFVDAALISIREFLEDDGLESIYVKFIAPASDAVRFGKPLNRSVIGSMNDLILHVGDWLIEDGLPPNEVGFRLNEIPFSSLKYVCPRDAFKKLAGERGLAPNEQDFRLKHPLPRTPTEWLKEIRLAIADAAEATPFGPVVGTEITDANLFQLAPLVCLKFRGRKLKGPEADRVTKVALANYVANSDADGINHDLQQRPLIGFALCYVAAHLALGLLDEVKAESTLNYCESHLE